MGSDLHESRVGICFYIFNLSLNTNMLNLEVPLHISENSMPYLGKFSDDSESGPSQVIGSCFQHTEYPHAVMKAM